MRRFRGFTLIELMLVLAIVAVLTGLAFSGFQAVNQASAPQNAINDLAGALNRAKSRAAERQTDVWVIIYPGFNRRSSPPAATGGPGAFFIVEDRLLEFNRGGTVPSGEVRYNNFDPTGTSPVLRATSYPTPTAFLLDEYYFDNYSNAPPRFVSPPSVRGSLGDPFGSIALTNPCSFCVPGGGVPVNRGAVVFSADGSALFLDAGGTPAPPMGSGLGMFTSSPGARAYGIAVGSNDAELKRLYLLGLSPGTGFMAVFPK